MTIRFEPDKTRVGYIKTRFGSKQGLVRHLLYSCFLRPFWKQPPLPVGSHRRFVFVCDGNICRSALAEAIATDHGLTAVSYGIATTAGLPANATMAAVAAELGYDLRRHLTRSISTYEPSADDLILVMEPRHLRAVTARISKGLRPPLGCLGLLSATPRIYLHDPFNMPEAYFRYCADLIEGAVKALAGTARGRQPFD